MEEIKQKREEVITMLTASLNAGGKVTPDIAVETASRQYIDLVEAGVIEDLEVQKVILSAQKEIQEEEDTEPEPECKCYQAKDGTCYSEQDIARMIVEAITNVSN